MKLHLWVLTFALLACGGDDDGGVDSAAAPVCGDSACNGTENCTSCPTDCGDCSCTPSDEYSCSGEEICIGTTCVAAFGRNYRFSISEFVVNAQDPDGEAWDSFGGAPDPYVVVALNNTVILITAEPQDTFTPSYTDSATVVIPGGSTLGCTGWDGDIGDDDWVISCELNPLTADFLRRRNITCVGTAGTGTLGTTLTLSIVPN